MKVEYCCDPLRDSPDHDLSKEPDGFVWVRDRIDNEMYNNCPFCDARIEVTTKNKGEDGMKDSMGFMVLCMRYFKLKHGVIKLKKKKEQFYCLDLKEKINQNAKKRSVLVNKIYRLLKLIK